MCWDAETWRAPWCPASSVLTSVSTGAIDALCSLPIECTNMSKFAVYVAIWCCLYQTGHTKHMPAVFMVSTSDQKCSTCLFLSTDRTNNADLGWTERNGVLLMSNRSIYFFLNLLVFCYANLILLATCFMLLCMTKLDPRHEGIYSYTLLLSEQKWQVPRKLWVG